MKTYYSRHKKCRGIIAAVVDNPAHKRDTAREVAKMMRREGHVMSASVERVRKMKWCACHA